jgi:uncharacterized phiE125 gp8 family phage protein
MATKLLIPPTIEPVTLEEAKKHCRIDGTEEDAAIEGWIKAAREYCEGFQNRAYCEQTLQLWLDDFPKVGQIQIPRPPLIGVDGLTYFDVDDNEHTMSPDDYFVDTQNEPGWIVLNHGCSWPTETLRPANGVCIRFRAGYGSGDYSDEVDMVPQKVKQATFLLIGHWYEQREATGQANLKDIPKGVDELLWLDRIL